MSPSLVLTVFTVLMILTSAHLLSVKKDPKSPVWPKYFQEQFVESYTNAGSFRTSGKYWYDSERKTTRMDRRNGVHDAFCGSVLPNVSANCVQLVRDSKRYIFYPQIRQCCICCDAAHGCDILKNNWLATAKYIGSQTLIDKTFDKWSIPDGDALDYYWATQDDKQILRKMSEVGSRIKDFIMVTYKEQKAADQVFALPSYCTSGKWCPKETTCGFFQ